MARSLSIYNQSVLNDDDFVTNFVARNAMLDTLIRRLRGISPEDGGSHHILIGPRGMGKTSMLRRIGIGITRDSFLSTKFVPLNFREEQYNVLRLADFWTNCGEALAEWAELNDRDDLANRIDAELASKAWTDDEHAGAALERLLAELGLRAVLLVDNLDLILDALTPEANWRLRRYLQAHGGPIVIGAATQPLRQSADRDEAFYEFFQPHHLDPLDAAETEACMRALAQRRGDAGVHVLDVLDQQPERLLTLHTLTGGNPRVLALIYRLLESAESNAAMADLEMLLDQVTPYYKARIEEYQSPQQRAVIDAISLNWDPVTTSDLAQLTRIVTTTLSPVLIRLRKDGLIETVDTSGSYSGHQLIERFFNIWYLMRHGTRRAKQKMRWLVAFLTSFYSTRELLEIESRARSNGDVKVWHADFAIAFREALSRSTSATIDRGRLPSSDRSHPATDDELSHVTALAEAANNCWEAGEVEGCIDKLDEIIRRHAASDDEVLRWRAAQALFNRAIARGHDGNYRAEIDEYDDLVQRFSKDGDKDIYRIVSAALINKGALLGLADQNVEAIDAFDAVLDRHQSHSDVDDRDILIRAMSAKAMTSQEIGRLAVVPDLLANAMALLTDESGEEAEEIIVQALMRHAGNLSGDEEIAAYDRVVQTFSGSKVASVLDWVRKALMNIAICLSTENRIDEAVATFDRIIDDPSFGPSRVLQMRVFRAITLAHDGRVEEAEKAFDAILPTLRAGSGETPNELLVQALRSKAFMYGQQKRYREEIALYDELVERVGDSSEQPMPLVVIKSMLDKAVSVGLLGQVDDEIAIYDDAIARFSDDADPQIQAQIARAMHYKGITLSQKDDYAAEFAVFREMQRRFAEATNHIAIHHLARAQARLGTLAELGNDIDEALEAYEGAIRGFATAGDEDDVEIDSAIHNRLADLLLDTGRDLSRAESLYKSLRQMDPIGADGGLAWLALLGGDLKQDFDFRTLLGALPDCGRALLNAGLELSQRNFGHATEHLEAAIQAGLKDDGRQYNREFERLLRLAHRTGFGEELIAWLDATGLGDQVLPYTVAFKAFVRGREALLDFNPEVRAPAEFLLARLLRGSPALADKTAAAQSLKSPPARRGRSRRKA